MANYKAYARGRWNTICDACPQEEKRRGRGPWECAYPCVGCGKKFSAEGVYCRVQERRYCSDQCQYDAKRTTLYRCSRCHKSMHADAFNRRQGSRVPNTICSKCEPRARLDVPSHERPRSSALEMYRNAMARANRESRAFALTKHQVRVIYRKSPCALCGDAVAAIRALGDGPLSIANFRGYCRRCLRLLAKLPHDDIVAAAGAIHEHQMSPQEASNAANP